MKNLKKVFAGSMALTCLLSTGMSAFAAEGKTDVAYDNSHQIVDPSDPTWAVRIPAAIEIFDGESLTPKYNVELINKTGTEIWPSVDLSIRSQSGYKLFLDGVQGADDVLYALTFTNNNKPDEKLGVFESSKGTSESLITQLNGNRIKLDGYASKLTMAQKQGLHKDIIIFKAVKYTT